MAVSLASDGPSTALFLITLFFITLNFLTTFPAMNAIALSFTSQLNYN